MSTKLILAQSVDAWLARDDVAVTGAEFPEILLIAEATIARKIRCSMQQTSTTLSFTGRSATLPTNFIEHRNAYIDSTTNRRMTYKTPDEFRNQVGYNDGRIGLTYTIEGDGDTELMNMLIAGPASASSPLSVELLYWKRFTALSANGDTNWLLANHFDAYLYAALRAAAEYLQEHELEDRYQAKFDRVCAELSTSEVRKQIGATPKASFGSPRSIV